ncbi:MAG: hypothetical protein JRF53_00685 [Deltaproteobacteria bacterium]|nr:hypothetical protein [Deltaproteobacteria bacterium]
MNLTEEQLYTLRHMLGINKPNDRIPRPYRNYAAVNPGDQKFAEMERLGAVERYEARAGSDYDYFQCTAAGKLAAIRSHRTIRKAKPQRRYSRFLDLCDAIPELTFKEFLTEPEFADIRESA